MEKMNIEGFGFLSGGFVEYSNPSQISSHWVNLRAFIVGDVLLAEHISLTSIL